MVRDYGDKMPGIFLTEFKKTSFTLALGIRAS